MPKIRYMKFQQLLLEKFPHEHDIQQTAHRMNIPASTFYHYIEGASTFPVDLIPNLYRATNDPDFLNFTLNDTDMMLTPRQPGDGSKSTLLETLDAAAAVRRDMMGDGSMVKAWNRGQRRAA